MPSTAVVIGGGITGLTAAYRLRERFGPGSVTLVEGTSRLGGKILTERAEGMILEGGPDSFLTSKPAALELCHQLGLADRLIDTNPALRRSFVKRAGRLHQLPDGITGLVPSRTWPLLTTGVLSLTGRLRAAIEPFIPPRTDDEDESVGTFGRRRFGLEAWQRLIEPLLSGIYAGDGDTLSLAATFPQLRAMDRRVGGVLGRQALHGPATPGALRRGFVSLAGGLGDLVDALSSRLASEQLVQGVPAVAITRRDGRYAIHLDDGTTLTSSVAILATPAFASAVLVELLDAALAEHLRQIPFVSSATVTLAFPRAAATRLPPGYGYVSPRIEGGTVVACTWTSNKFPTRAPADMVLLRCFTGRAGDELDDAIPDDALIGIARVELEQVLGITATPLLTRVCRWPRGTPQYTLGHQERVARIFHAAGNHPGLFLAGASYCGVGLPDCVTSGWRAADSAISWLGTV